MTAYRSKTAAKVLDTPRRPIHKPLPRKLMEKLNSSTSKPGSATARMNKGISEAEASQVLFFKNADGAIVQVSPSNLGIYTGVKCEQLESILHLLTEVHINGLQMDKRDVEVFQLMANSIGHDLSKLIDIMDKTLVPAEGGV